MGLDMHLERHTYVKRWRHMTPDRLFTVAVERGGKPFPQIKPERVAYVIEELAYWRKNYSIHEWMVRNVMNGVADCHPHYVTRDQIEELADYAEEIGDHQTVATLWQLLKEHDDAAWPDQGSFYYRASW